MKAIIHAAIGSGLLGILIAVVGFHFINWQFWAILLTSNTWYFTKPTAEV